MNNSKDYTHCMVANLKQINKKVYTKNHELLQENSVSRVTMLSFSIIAKFDLPTNLWK